MTVVAIPGFNPIIVPVPQFLPVGQQPSGTWDVIATEGNNAKIDGGNPAVSPGWGRS